MLIGFASWLANLRSFITLCGSDVGKWAGAQWNVFHQCTFEDVIPGRSLYLCRSTKHCSLCFSFVLWFSNELSTFEFWIWMWCNGLILQFPVLWDCWLYVEIVEERQKIDFALLTKIPHFQGKVIKLLILAALINILSIFYG